MMTTKLVTALHIELKIFQIKYFKISNNRHQNCQDTVQKKKHLS
jgi:hypothetical protein